MKISVKTINSILEREDVEGYIGLGAPSDEYASEATDIFEAIQQLRDSEVTEENILAILTLKWIENFNLSELDMVQRRDALQRVTKKVLKAIQANNAQ